MEVVDQGTIIKKIRELINILYTFYKGIWETIKSGSELEEADYEKRYLVFQQRYASKMLETIDALPHKIADRIYYDIIYKLTDIKDHLEKIYITSLYGLKRGIPEAFTVSLEEALDMPLKAFNTLLEAFDNYETPEIFKEKVGEISRLERVMDQSHLTIMRQIEGSKGKGDDFNLMIVFKVTHSLEAIVDCVEDIANRISR